MFKRGVTSVRAICMRRAEQDTRRRGAARAWQSRKSHFRAKYPFGRQSSLRDRKAQLSSMVDCPISLAIHPHRRSSPPSARGRSSRSTSRSNARQEVSCHVATLGLPFILADPYLASCTVRGDPNSGARKPGPVVNNGSGSGYKKGKNGLKRGESEGEAK